MSVEKEGHAVFLNETVISKGLCQNCCRKSTLKVGMYKAFDGAVLDIKKRPLVTVDCM